MRNFLFSKLSNLTGFWVLGYGVMGIVKPDPKNSITKTIISVKLIRYMSVINILSILTSELTSEHTSNLPHTYLKIFLTSMLTSVLTSDLPHL